MERGQIIEEYITLIREMGKGGYLGTEREVKPEEGGNKVKDNSRMQLIWIGNGKGERRKGKGDKYRKNMWVGKIILWMAEEVTRITLLTIPTPRKEK